MNPTAGIGEGIVMLACIVLRRTLGTVVGCALALLGWFLRTPAASVSAVNTLHVTDCGDVGTNTLRGKIGLAGVGTRLSSTGPARSR